MPVSNIEFMYESAPVAGCAGSCCSDCASSPSDVSTMRKVMYDLYLAGASGAWYWCDSAWDIITLGTSKGYQYCSILSKFLSSVKHLVEMEPHDELLTVDKQGVEYIGHVLALRGVEYVIHVRSVDSGFSISITDATTPLTGLWFDPVTGNSSTLVSSLANGTHQFTAPKGFAADDIVLHLYQPTIVPGDVH